MPVGFRDDPTDNGQGAGWVGCDEHEDEDDDDDVNLSQLFLLTPQTHHIQHHMYCHRAAVDEKHVGYHPP